jgi:hypothetical protein
MRLIKSHQIVSNLKSIISTIKSNFKLYYSYARIEKLKKQKEKRWRKVRKIRI